jgi:substrate import-associated zinc metallohydrolase lipoprotein
MKKSLTYILVVLMATCFYACSEDSLSSESVIKVDQRKQNEFDLWLAKTYTKEYNLDFKYRLEDNESDKKYALVPADYNQSIRMANLVKYLCLDAYNEVTGSTIFMKKYFPKMIQLVGSAAYLNNGTRVLGTAEGGLKITLYEINSLDPTDVEQLNENYFRTIHHEFFHILHQTIAYSADFAKITATTYVNDSWSKKSSSDALKAGFITPYASKEANEDFVELVANYITHTQAEWDKSLATAGTTGKPIIDQKFTIVYNYTKTTWGIDLNALREVILRRSAAVGTLDLDKLN